ERDAQNGAGSLLRSDRPKVETTGDVRIDATARNITRRERRSRRFDLGLVGLKGSRSPNSDGPFVRDDQSNRRHPKERRECAVCLGGGPFGTGRRRDLPTVELKNRELLLQTSRLFGSALRGEGDSARYKSNNEQQTHSPDICRVVDRETVARRRQEKIE